MKITAFVALSTLISAGMFGQSGLTGSCRNGGTYPRCVGGEIVFTGSSYPAQVHVTVTNSTGTAIDDGDYKTDAGVLSFAENLSFADTYQIRIDGKAALTVTTN